MKSLNFLQACTIRVFAGCLVLAVVVNVQILRSLSVHLTLDKGFYLLHRRNQLISPESIPTKRNKVKNDIFEKYHSGAYPRSEKPATFEAMTESVREDLSCVLSPNYCTDFKAKWPPCSVSGKRLPGGQSLCTCTKNSNIVL
jgi:hypothetical protein